MDKKPDDRRPVPSTEWWRKRSAPETARLISWALHRWYGFPPLDLKQSQSLIKAIQRLALAAGIDRDLAADARNELHWRRPYDGKRGAGPRAHLIGIALRDLYFRTYPHRSFEKTLKGRHESPACPYRSRWGPGPLFVGIICRYLGEVPPKNGETIRKYRRRFKSK